MICVILEFLRNRAYNQYIEKQISSEEFMKQLYPIFLASKSPRRREILTLMGVTFEVADSDADENITASSPEALVEELSLRKAELAAVPDGKAVIIGADTVVSYENSILGKPKDEEDAFRMLRLLSGRYSSVYTGVTIIVCDENRTCCTFHTRSEVLFDDLSDEEIREYIATGEPMDKAGAYGIQGRFGRHIRSLSGDYYNVMGLPMNDLYKKLKELGIIFI